MNTKEKENKWHRYFMRLCYAVAEKSQDNSTKVGAIIVGPDKEIRSTGFNGFPRGVSQFPIRECRPDKYSWTEHAERNAIYQAAMSGVSTKGCTMYVQWQPCADCARAIIQCGIKTVVFEKETTNGKSGDPVRDKMWSDSHKVSKQMFKEAKVEYLSISKSELVK